MTDRELLHLIGRRHALNCQDYRPGPAEIREPWRVREALNAAIARELARRGGRWDRGGVAYVLTEDRLNWVALFPDDARPAFARGWSYAGGVVTPGRMERAEAFTNDNRPTKAHVRAVAARPIGGAA